MTLMDAALYAVIIVPIITFTCVMAPFMRYAMAIAAIMFTALVFHSIGVAGGLAFGGLAFGGLGTVELLRLSGRNPMPDDGMSSMSEYRVKYHDAGYVNGGGLYNG